ELLGAVLRLPLSEGGYLRKAWCTPRCPEIEKDYLPTEESQLNFPVAQVHAGEVWRGTVHYRRRNSCLRDKRRPHDGERQGYQQK
ncbi:MAG TPA: hypothetical protein VK638_02965, partial [Edaphobacter sp.]|nr:hypothetical protein [Edaphobacter sp.]